MSCQEFPTTLLLVARLITRLNSSYNPSGDILILIRKKEDYTSKALQ